MRIGIDAHCLEGNRTGVGRYLSSILKEWEKQNSDHEFILYFKDNIPEEFSGINNNFSPRLLPKIALRSSTALFMHIAIPAAVKKDDPEVMFFPEYIAPIAIKKPYVLTLHDIVYAARPDLHYRPSFLDQFLLNTVSKLAAKKAEAILVPSNFVKNEIHKIWNIEKNKIHITPEAAGEEFRPVNNMSYNTEVLSRYGIEDKFFFFVGSAFKRRHVRECMEAFANIAVQYKNYQFLVVGTDRYGSGGELNTLSESLNKALKRRAFVRRNFAESADLPYLYSSAKATVWLSEYEGFGLPPLESLSCGTPVITNKAASLPEVVGDCAIFVDDISDIRSIYRAMLRAIEDEETMQKLISCSTEQAGKFSWSLCAQQTLEILLKAD